MDRRPVRERSWPVPVSGPTAYLVSTYLRRKNEFSSWLEGARQHLTPEEFREVLENLEDLQAKGDEYRTMRSEGRETAKPRRAQPAAALVQHVTVAAAAKELDVSEQMVRRYCQGGQLDAVKYRDGWRIDPAGLAMFKLGSAA